MAKEVLYNSLTLFFQVSLRRVGRKRCTKQIRVKGKRGDLSLRFFLVFSQQQSESARFWAPDRTRGFSSFPPVYFLPPLRRRRLRDEERLRHPVCAFNKTRERELVLKRVKERFKERRGLPPPFSFVEVFLSLVCLTDEGGEGGDSPNKVPLMARKLQQEISLFLSKKKYDLIPSF